MATNTFLPTEYAQTLEEIKNRVRAAQYEALKAVNRELVALYWDIGEMIAQRQKEHGWGKSVVETLANDLQNEFPGVRGFSTQNLWYMRQFYLSYAGHPKLQPLVGEISWSKHLVIMGQCKEDLEREFYIRMTRKFGWTKNVLALRIQDQTYEKTMLGQTNFEKTIPDTFRNQARLAVRDECTSDFLEPGNAHSERELKRAIIARIEQFPTPFIGMILCREKKRAVVEYALRDSHKPIGVATYRIIRRLPAELKGKLPDPKQIERLMESVEWLNEKEDSGSGEGL